MFKRIFGRKTIAQIQSEASAATLHRTLTRWNLVSLGIGCIIGAGIFVMTGTAAAQYAGPSIILSFVFTGIACAFVGLCYAELASLLPVSGSAYTYAYATLGEVFAWIVGWLLLLEYGVAAATVAVGWSGYIVSFLRDFGVIIPPEFTVAMNQHVPVNETLLSVYEPLGYTIQTVTEHDKPVTYLANAAGELIRGTFNVPAAFGITAVGTLLVIGVRESAKINNIIVAIKLAVVLTFVALGFFYINPENWHPFIPEATGPGNFGWGGIFRAASIIFFAYVGFEAVSTAAQEAKDPQKDMPFGILMSLFICTLLYMGVAAVLTGIVPYNLLNVPDPMAVAVDYIGLSWFAVAIKIGAITGLTSVMLVLLYGQTRIFFTMSKDGLLPIALSAVHEKYKTPYINTIIVTALVALVAGFTPISLLGDLVSLGTLVAFMIVCLTVLYLRKAEPNLPRPFKTPGMPFVPLLGIALCGYLVFSIFFGFNSEGMVELTHSGAKVLEYTGPYLLVGALIYVLYGCRHSALLPPKP